MMRDERLTYQQFELLMSELGYRPVHTIQAKDRLWKNQAFDALKYLPQAPPEELVPRHHLITLRKVSVEKGIVEEKEFHRLLQAAQQEGFLSPVNHAA